MYKSRQMVIATKHKKEKVIAPLFQKYLGISCFVPEDFDTDTFGTFTGERERKADPISTARSKCQQAMELYNIDLGVASEGSFGPHPSLFFVYGNEETLVFIDRRNNFEIVGRALSTETNFNGSEISTEEQLVSFAGSAQFPSHALVLRKAKLVYKGEIKGITDWEHLKTSFKKLIERYGTAYVETDMRALYNPCRMKVIKEATLKLLENIQSCCPACGTPGFCVTSTKEGLPCGFCGSPTFSILSNNYTCQQCAFTCEERYPNKKFTEDPMYCSYCNP